MVELFRDDKPLMKFLGVETDQLSLFGGANEANKTSAVKDKGQREACGCIMSKDIGQYNTCPHECVYCYANTSKEIARRNYKTHRRYPFTDTITGS